jgi:hypothetical protein
LTGGHKHTRHYLLIMKSACSSTLANGSIDTNEENRDTGRASEKPRLVDGRFGESVEFFWSRSRNPEPHGNTLSRGMRETKAAHIVFVEYKSSVSKIPSAPTIPEANYKKPGRGYHDILGIAWSTQLHRTTRGSPASAHPNDIHSPSGLFPLPAKNPSDPRRAPAPALETKIQNHSKAPVVIRLARCPRIMVFIDNKRKS